MKEDQHMVYQCVYPEVYYRVMPFVMMACDEFDAGDYEMLSPEMVRQTTDRIYEDVCRIHPELAEWDQYSEMSYEAAAAYNISGSYVETQQFRGGGFFRDLITIILLDEFFGRRRRRRFY